MVDLPVLIFGSSPSKLLGRVANEILKVSVAVGTKRWQGSENIPYHMVCVCVCVCVLLLSLARVAAVSGSLQKLEEEKYVNYTRSLRPKKKHSEKPQGTRYQAKLATASSCVKCVRTARLPLLCKMC